MTAIDEVFATDEDVLLRAPTDFLLICPRHQSLATAKDGGFVSGEPWTLRSSTTNFLARGIEPGHVVQLIGASTTLGPSGDLLGVSMVGEDSLVLRRPGQPAGVGQPPGTFGGVIGLEFRIPTLRPQIELASREIARRCGADPRVQGWWLGDLDVTNAIRDATVLSVLLQRYLDLGRGERSGDNPLADKIAMYSGMIEDLLARLMLRRVGDFARDAIPIQTRLTRLSR